jgi:hypothetical protein
MTQPQMVAQPAAPAPLQLQGGFEINPQNPQVGALILGDGLMQMQIILPTANVVGFLRQLADDTERKIQATPALVRPASGLFVPGH